MLNDNKRIARNTILLSIRMIVVLVISLYTSRVVLAALGIEDFGIYNVVAGFVTMFTFLNSAMATGVQRFYNTELALHGKEGANKVYITAVQTQSVLAILTLLLLETIGLWYIYTKMVIPDDRFGAALFVFQMSAISMVIMMIQVPYHAAIMAHEKMDFYAILGIIEHLLKLLVVIVLPYLPGDSLKVYGLLIMLIGLSNICLSYIYSKLKFDEISYRFVFYKSLFCRMLTFSGWNVFGKFSIVMRSQGINMILNLFFGPVVNAARGVAFQVNAAVSGFVSNVNVAVKPQLTQSYAVGDIKRTFNLMFSISKVNYFVLLVMALPICLEIDRILHLWLGENVPDYTGIFVILVLMTSLVGTLTPPVSFVVHATGVMRKYQLITSAIDLCVIPISFIVLKMGAEPQMVFVVTLLLTCVGFVVSLKILQGIVYFSIRQYFMKVISPLIIITFISIVIPFSLKLLMIDSLFRLIIVSLLSLVVTVSSFYIIALDKSERELLNQYVKSIIYGRK